MKLKLKEIFKFKMQRIDYIVLFLGITLIVLSGTFYIGYYAAQYLQLAIFWLFGLPQ